MQITSGEHASGKRDGSAEMICVRPLTRKMLRAELTGSHVCSCGTITVRSSSPVIALARELIKAGIDPATQIYRGSTLSIRPALLARRRS